MLDRNAAIESELRFHLCRCTGYKKIIESIQAAGAALVSGADIAPMSTTGKVGSRLAKYDIRNVVLGKRPYVADMRIAGMLHGALRFSDHPRAQVLKIDTSNSRGDLQAIVRTWDVALRFLAVSQTMT